MVRFAPTSVASLWPEAELLALAHYEPCEIPDWRKFLDEDNWHAAAKVFQRLDDKSLQSLTEDIAKNGLLERITLFEGKLVDGRNRILACDKAGATPKFVALTNVPFPITDWVWAMNAERRHLEKDQLLLCKLEFSKLDNEREYRESLARMHRGRPRAQAQASEVERGLW